MKFNEWIIRYIHLEACIVMSIFGCLNFGLYTKITNLKANSKIISTFFITSIFAEKILLLFQIQLIWLAEIIMSFALTSAWYSSILPRSGWNYRSTLSKYGQLTMHCEPFLKRSEIVEGARFGPPHLYSYHSTTEMNSTTSILCKN